MGANLLFLSPKPGLCRIDDFVPDTYVAVLSQYYEKISQFLLTQALFAGILRTFSIDLHFARSFVPISLGAANLRERKRFLRRTVVKCT